MRTDTAYAIVANPATITPIVRAGAGLRQGEAFGLRVADIDFLRHRLLDAGESIRALADYLGHTDPGFTLRVYTHLIQASEARSRRAIDHVFGTSRVRAVSNSAATT